MYIHGLFIALRVLFPTIAGKIVYSDLKFLEVVGKGGFGIVWRGEWMPGKKVVAIKKMDKFEREVSYDVYIVFINILYARWTDSI